MTDNKKNRGLSGITLFLFVLIVLGVLWFINTLDSKESQLSRQKFEKLITSEKVDSVTITQNKNVPTGSVEVQLKNKKNGENEKNYLYVSDVNEIQKYLDKAKIDYEMSDVPRDNWFATTILPGIAYDGWIFPDFYDDEPSGWRCKFQSDEFWKKPCKTQHRAG